MTEFILGNASFGYWTEISSYQALQQAVDHGRQLRRENDCRYQVWREPVAHGELQTLVWDTRDDS